MVKLRFEIWRDDDGRATSIALCLAGPDGAEAHRSNEPGAVLVHTFEAEGWYEACAIRNRLMGWGDYKPDPSWGPDIPFTVEQKRRQDSG